MKTASALAITLSALLAACASSQKFAPNDPLEIPADIAGIVHAGRTRTQREYAYLNHLGVSWVLHTFNWNSIEPEQNEWDFLLYDALVDRNKAAGIKIIGILAYDNWWIHDDMDDHRYIPPQRLPDFLQYVRKTVEHFRGRVDAWCIWNEPNFHFWNGTDEEFIELARLTADAVREVDSEVILLGGGFNRNITGLPEKFIRRLFESGAMDKTDAIAFHPYELNPMRTALLFEQFRKIVDDYGFGDRIWITEVGYPTGGWYPTATSKKKFPAYVVKTFVNLSISGAQKILWYQLFDPITRVRSNSEDFFGLVRNRRNYDSKGAEAFRLCAVHLAGTVYRPDLPPRTGLPHSLRTFYFEQPTGGTLVLWKDGISTRITLQVPDGSVVHDPVSGSATPLSAETTITVGSMPVFVTWTGDGAVRIKTR